MRVYAFHGNMHTRIKANRDWHGTFRRAGAGAHAVTRRPAAECLQRIVLLLLAVCPLHSMAEWDSGSSQNLFVKVKLDEHWFVTSRNNFATRDGYDDLFLGYFDANLGYQLAPHWSLEAGYRRQWIEVGSRTVNEHRPLLNLIWRDRINGWNFSNRARVEFRFFENIFSDRIRCRNEFVAISPLELTPLRLRPYVSDEVFYEFTDNGFNLNWLEGGVRYKLNSNVGFKLGYRWQALKRNDAWNHTHVFVTGVSLLFL